MLWIFIQCNPLFMSGQYSQNNCITLQKGNLKIQCASAVISIISKVSMVTLKGTTTFRGSVSLILILTLPIAMLNVCSSVLVTAHNRKKCPFCLLCVTVHNYIK